MGATNFKRVFFGGSAQQCVEMRRNARFCESLQYQKCGYSMPAPHTPKHAGILCRLCLRILRLHRLHSYGPLNERVCVCPTRWLADWPFEGLLVVALALAKSSGGSSTGLNSFIFGARGK